MKTLFLVPAIVFVAPTVFAQVQAQEVVAEGDFMSAGAHHTRGMVKIEKRGSQLVLVFDSAFQTDQGPDLRVVLRDSISAKPMVVVANLKNIAGAQEYLLPMDESIIKNFDQVVIYCLQFHVDFGIATIVDR